MWRWLVWVLCWYLLLVLGCIRLVCNIFSPPAEEGSGGRISWRDSNIKAIDKKNESSVSWPGPGAGSLQTQTGGNIFQSTEIRHARPGQALWRGLTELTVWILLGLSQFDWWMPSQYSSETETKHQMASAFYLLLGCKLCCLFTNVYLLQDMKTEDFSLLFWLIPPICHQMISPPPHLSSLLNKLIGMVTLLVAHITSLPPPTKVYLLISCDVCWPATRQPGVSIKHTFSKKNIMSQ